MRILLVEDDPQLGDAVQVGLTQDLYAVDWVRTGEEAETALRAGSYTLALIDVGLPGMSGTNLLESLRRHGERVPVIVITARHRLEDRIDALDLGADDYVMKPFDLDELSARIRAVVRRAEGGRRAPLRFEDIELDPARRTVNVAGKSVELARPEYVLLFELMRQPGVVLSRTKLEDSLYGWGTEVGSNAVEVHIHHLRRKLGVEAIRTVRGAGYKLDSRE